MKIITFTKELIPLVQSGQKTQTRRKISYREIKEPDYKEANPLVTFGRDCKYRKAINRYKAGDICIIKNSRFKPETYGYIRINKVTKQDIYQVTETDAIAEGFDNRQDFLIYFSNIHYPHDYNYLPNMDVWKIEFEYISEKHYKMSKEHK